MDYVFVLDVSGSMEDDGKLKQSQKSLASFIRALGAEDRFEVMAFNNQPHPLFGSLENAGDETKKKAMEFLESQPARGGTVLSPAMKAAYKYAAEGDGAGKGARPLNVVLMSDGLTESGETSTLVKLIKERPEASRVFCIGVGNDVNRALLEEIANDSGGLAAFLSRDDDFERQAAAFRRKLLRPVATDLKIDFAGAEVYDLEPRKLPNLYHGMPVRMYGRYRKGGSATVNVSAQVAGKPLTQKVTVELPKEDDSNPEIERMWAWNRIDRLQKEADASGSGREAVKPEIVRLGEGYSIATEYTSFLVLENDGEYQRWKIDRRNSLRVARDQASGARVAEELAKLRERSEKTVAAAEDRTLTLSSAAPASGAAPAVTPPVNRAPASSSGPVATPSTPSPSPRSHDISFGGGSSGGGSGGGGAIDPISGIVLVGMGTLGILAKKSGRREKEV
jgi:Ca-activated chloride channel family protein